MNYRQVHLDFHTSPVIEGIGESFSREQFAAALKAGHINSITLFSKCHHGYAYHPSEANEIHPNLKFDLLGEQLAVCRELGVNAPVYISAGFDEKEVLRHPEWLNVSCPGSGPNFVSDAHYHLLCYNTPYLDKLIAQIDEVMCRYNPSGIFLDISSVRVCYCAHCVAGMQKEGINISDYGQVAAYGERVYANYCRRVEETVRKYNPNTKIFHNAGNISRGRRDIAGYDTHLEIESLPTGGWGYDHFPMSAAYVRNLGKEYLGMTGKFHTTWGEFGGFKHPNALRYEVALSLALGAKCSVGDQLHPSGEMNMSTYRLIGQAYAEVERKEKWCEGAESVSDVAVLSCEGCGVGNGKSDTGACRVLLEGKYTFDLLDMECDFSKYKLLILPDHITVDRVRKEKLDDYLARGGKLLLTGDSGLWSNSFGAGFAFDIGAEYVGTNEYTPSYMIPSAELKMINGVTEYVMYTAAKNIAPTDGKVFAYLSEPYFNRAPYRFSSHQHTPNRPGVKRPAAVLNEKENIAYIAWNIFEDYAGKGSLHLKELAVNAIEMLIGKEKTIIVNGLPDRGIVTLTKQGKRYVNHLLFAHTCLRGSGIEVIEDTVPIYNVEVSVKLQSRPTRVYFAPEEKDIEYNFENGILTYLVDKFEIHQMIVIDME